RVRADSGVRAARALDPRRTGLSTSVAKRQFAARFTGAAARFSSRTQRVSGVSAAASTAVDLTNIYLLELAPTADVEMAVKRYAADPHVEYAQPNYYVEASFTPNDFYYNRSGSWGQPYDDLW